MAVYMLKVGENLELFVVLFQFPDELSKGFRIYIRREMEKNPDLIHLVVIDCISRIGTWRLSCFGTASFEHQVFNEIQNHF